MINRTVNIKPMGKARPRITTNGTFMPPAYKKWQKDFRILFGGFDIDGLVSLHVTAVRKLPKRTSNKPGDYCTAGPDSDNIAGAVMDALFEDDSVVVAQSCIKQWGNDNWLKVTLEQVQ